MRIITCLFFLFMLNSAMAQQGVLFLVAGQSNAVGQGDSTSSVQCNPLEAYEYKFVIDSVIALKDPVGCHELHFEKANTGSAWPAFANAYNTLTGSKVIIVQAARGGSSSHYKAELNDYGTWDDRGRVPLLDSAVIKTKGAVKKTGLQVRGIIWSQGERDANAINTQQLSATEYESALEHVIIRFRKQFGANTKFYIIQTGYYIHHPVQGFDIVRKIQENISKRMKQIYIVYNQTGAFKNKGWMKDEIHYSQNALNDIGVEIAKQVVRVEKY